LKKAFGQVTVLKRNKNTNSMSQCKKNTHIKRIGVKCPGRVYVSPRHANKYSAHPGHHAVNKKYGNPVEEEQTVLTGCFRCLMHAL